MKHLILAVLIALLAAPFTAGAAVSGNCCGDLLFKDCLTRSPPNICYPLLTFMDGSNLKATLCIAHFRSNGVADPLATNICRWYFNDNP